MGDSLFLGLPRVVTFCSRDIGKVSLEDSLPSGPTEDFHPLGEISSFIISRRISSSFLRLSSSSRSVGDFWREAWLLSVEGEM